MRMNRRKKITPKNVCLECGGDLESVDNVDSHTNLRTCIANLKERVSSLLDEINFPEG